MRRGQGRRVCLSRPEDGIGKNKLGLLGLDLASYPYLDIFFSFLVRIPVHYINSDTSR
jgi:hypothetical protein